MGTPDSRPEDDLVGVLSQNFPGEFVTNIVRETGVGRKVGGGFIRVDSVVDRFQEKNGEES